MRCWRSVVKCRIDEINVNGVLSRVHLSIFTLIRNDRIIRASHIWLNNTHVTFSLPSSCSSSYSIVCYRTANFWSNDCDKIENCPRSCSFNWSLDLTLAMTWSQIMSVVKVPQVFTASFHCNWQWRRLQVKSVFPFPCSTSSARTTLFKYNFLVE